METKAPANHEGRISAVEEGQKVMESRLNVHDDAIHRLASLSAGLERDIRNNGMQISRLDEAVNTLHKIAATVATKADIASLEGNVTSALLDANDSVSIRAVTLFVGAIVVVSLVSLAVVVISI